MTQKERVAIAKWLEERKDIVKTLTFPEIVERVQDAKIAFSTDSVIRNILKDWEIEYVKSRVYKSKNSESTEKALRGLCEEILNGAGIRHGAQTALDILNES
jgi:transposase